MHFQRHKDKFRLQCIMCSYLLITFKKKSPPPLWLCMASSLTGKPCTVPVVWLILTKSIDKSFSSHVTMTDSKVQILWRTEPFVTEPKLLFMSPLSLIVPILLTLYDLNTHSNTCSFVKGVVSIYLLMKALKIKKKI